MFNQKSAKDQLAQFPKRYAEGGEATPVETPVPVPAASGVGAVNIPTWASPNPTNPRPTTPVAGTAGPSPVVEARRTQLTPFNQLPVSPLALSSSQQAARDRAAKQEAIDAAIAQAYAPLSSLERRALLQKMYKGDLTPDTLKTQVIEPLYEKRVTNAFKAIGLPGTNTMPGQAAPTTAYEYWLNQLKTGEITGAEFENKFLTSASQAPTWSSDVKTQLDAANKARKALGMKELTERDLPGYVAPRPSYGFGFGYNNPMGFNTNRGMNSMLGTAFRIAKPATPAPEPIKPVDFSKPTTTQLFAEGGAVKKLEEAGSKLDPVYVETASLRKQIEDSLPKDKYFETYPVRIVDTMKNAMDFEGGVSRPYGEPGVININPKGNFKDKYGTFEHERQHLIDAKRGKTELRYPAPEYIPEDAKYNKPTVPVDKELQFKTKNDIYSAFQKYRKELGLSADFVEEGFFSEIRRLEKGLPVGKSILDTNIGKDLFANNPELLQTYWSRTRPQFTTYMTEQRDSPRYKMEKQSDIYKEQPKTTEKGTLTKVQDFIRSKTVN